MDDEYYPSDANFDDYRNVIDQSLPFHNLSSSDFYLNEETFSFPSMFTERPYHPQDIFSGLRSRYDQSQIRVPSIADDGDNDRHVNETQYSEQLVPKQESANIYSFPGAQDVAEESQLDRGHRSDEEQHCKSMRPHEQKPRAHSASKASRTPSSNVFKLDVRIPSLSLDNQPIATQESLSSVFEVNWNSNSKRKTRSSFTAQGKKKVEAVRNVGACIQCKFRKRTCGTSEPCHLCIRRTGNPESAATLCTRESPFVDLSVTEFYSNRCHNRVVDFEFDFSSSPATGPRQFVKICCKGPTSWPIRLQVMDTQLASLEPETRQRIEQIVESNPEAAPLSRNDNDRNHPGTVTILDTKSISSFMLEKWVMEYTYRLNKYHSDNSASFLFGVMYAQQKLPHAHLVANMTKLVALNYVLSNQLEILDDHGQSTIGRISDYPILLAQFHTLLFQSLYNTEKAVYQELQRLVFKTSGQLAKDAIVPVALVLWLLTRIQRSRASYLIVMSQSEQNSSLTPSEESINRQKHALDLLISVFTALFRSSFPLLMNFEDKCNRDLLGGDEDLLQLAKELRKELLLFKQKVRPCMYNIGYRKEEVDRLLDMLIE